MQASKSSGKKPAPPAAPFSTGGGGTVFEHHYGAVLLSHLLARTPIPALGDHVTPRRVHFQAKDVSPVDDMLVNGEAESGDTHWLSIGARHQPRLTKRDSSSVELIETYLQIVTEHWPEVESGRWRLALAVGPSYPPAVQLDKLTRIAQAAGSGPEFRKDVRELGRATDPVRNRLNRVDEIVAQIAAASDFNARGCSTAELTWRLLSGLSVIEVRLEGTNPLDRTNAIERLQSQTPDGQIPTAEKLYSRLTEIVAGYAPNGARVNRNMLCAALRGHACFKQADDEDVVADDSDIKPADRAEALMLGPLQAIAGLAELVHSAEEATEGDPATAARTMEQAAQSLDKRGFRGNALLLRRQFAKDLQAAGHNAYAADVLISLVERLVGQGADYEARFPAIDLRRLHNSGALPSEKQRAAHAALVLYDTVRHPFDDLTALVDIFGTIGSESGEHKAVYALALAEAAVTTDQMTLIAEHGKALNEAANSTNDKLTAARIRLALAEATANWDGIVTQARRYRLPRPVAALILARYGRHMTLIAKPDEADEAWWQAIERGAVAELGDDTAEWLYAVRENAKRYGPITDSFETHPQAQAMRLSKGRSLLPTYRDHHADALAEFHNGDLAAASASARRALRDAVTRGHLFSEFIAAGLLADIYAASSEGGRAAALYVRTGQADKLTDLLERLGDHYVDLTHYLDSPAPWQRYATYKAIVAQADLIHDDQVERLIERALSDVMAGLSGGIRQGPLFLAPQVEFAALEAVASLIERGTAEQVHTILETLKPLVPRDPHTYKHTDEGHVRTLAAILDRDDNFGTAAANQLLDMLALNESVSQNVLEIADDSIFGRIDLFERRLPQLIDTSFTAAWLLGQLNLTPPQGSQAVRTAFDTLTAPYQQPAGVFGMGLPLARNAQLARHLSREECETAVHAQLARARNHGQPAANRWQSIDALRVLSSSVSADTKKELFDAGIAFARGLEDGSALDDIAGPAHPLSHFKISLGMASLAVPGIRLAAATASDVASAELVERAAIPLLNQPNREITNGTVFALRLLGEHPAALPATALAIHGDPSVRSLAAVRWTQQASRDLEVGLGLANDVDYHVRLSLARAIAQSTQVADNDFVAVIEKLKHDPRHSVRRAAQSQHAAKPNKN